jgi:hypothetical protein
VFSYATTGGTLFVRQSDRARGDHFDGRRQCAASDQVEIAGMDRRISFIARCG